MDTTTIIIGLVLAIIGVAAGYFIGKSSTKNAVDKIEADAKADADKKLADAKSTAEKIVADANRSGENTKKDKMLEAKEFFIKQKSEFEEDTNRRRNQMLQNENKLKQMPSGAGLFRPEVSRLSVACADTFGPN